MIKKSIFLTPLLLLGGESFIEFQSFIANNAIPLKNIASDWSGKYQSPKKHFKVLEFSDLQIGYKDQNFSISYIIKSDLFIKASKDFSDLLYTVKQSQDLQTNRIYDLSLKLEGFVAQGLKYGQKIYNYKKDSLEISVKGFVSVLKGEFLQYADIKGFAVASDKNTYSFNADMEYYYSKNYFYDLTVKKPSAIGYSGDISMNTRFKNYSFNLIYENLVGYLFWKNAPYSDVHLKSDNTKIENGEKKYNPTVYGYEGKRSLKEKISPKITSTLSYNNDFYKISLSNLHYKSINLPFITIEKPAKNYTLSLQYETSFKTMTISIKNKRFSFFIGAENPNLKINRSLHLGFSFFHPF